MNELIQTIKTGDEYNTMNELIQTNQDECNTMNELIQTIKTGVTQWTN